MDSNLNFDPSQLAQEALAPTKEATIRVTDIQEVRVT